MKLVFTRMGTLLRVLTRLKPSQWVGRLRLRWRQRQIVRKGLAAALPRHRLELAPDWAIRVQRLSMPSEASSENGSVPASGKPPSPKDSPQSLSLEQGQQLTEADTIEFSQVAGTLFHANDAWLVFGPGRRMQHRRELARIELYYHEFLTDGSLTDPRSWSFLENYLMGHRQRASDSVLEWHPYAISNRLVHWLQFLARTLEPGKAPDTRREQLASECLLLADAIEWLLERDIEGNHYLKNLWALAIADILLHPRSTAVQQSLTEYLNQLERQLLTDGAHYELCPMYHAKVLADARMLLSILVGDRPERARLERLLDHGFQWLETQRSGPYSWFNWNDSWRIPELARWIWQDRPWRPVPGHTHQAASGFIRGTHECGWVWSLDVGGVGPSFNPGHCHSDVLSLILHHQGSPILVDPGTLHYSPNDERAFLKSCHAHNGPCLADSDHTEMIGSFRIGRAAHGDGVRLSGGPDLQRAEAGHDGYSFGRIRREISVGQNKLTWIDEWSPKMGRAYRPWLRLLWGFPISTVHLIDLGVRQCRFRCSCANVAGSYEILIRVEGGEPPRMRLAESSYSDGFGHLSSATEWVLSADPTRDQVRVLGEILVR